MHVVFVSNFMNHHQRSFVESLIGLGCQVTFVSTESLPQERAAMGYRTDLTHGRNISYSAETKDEIDRLCMEADAVIFGSKPKALFAKRVNSGKLTFNYSERLFKKSFLQALSPIHKIRLRRSYVFDGKKTPYLLAAGAYSAQDYRRLGYPKNKILKWGYFPPLTETPLSEMLACKEKHTILWVSRFIDWKHPELVVELGEFLKKQKVPFKIKMIGIGNLLESTQKEITSKGLSDDIQIIPGMPPEQVRKEFEKAPIFILTSGRGEGWGAVVNEAMNSGCAVVASKLIGSSTYLIHDGKNGMTYTNKMDLFRKVSRLLSDAELREELGRQGYHTITDLWNYEVATQRFVEFVRDQANAYVEGPMSKG